MFLDASAIICAMRSQKSSATKRVPASTLRRGRGGVKKMLLRMRISFDSNKRAAPKSFQTENLDAGEKNGSRAAANAKRQCA
jgi:hypothetical protein